MTVYQVGGSEYEIPAGTPPAKVKSILRTLAEREKMSPLRGGVTYGVQGVNVGLADVLGIPVDVMAGGLNIGARALDLPEIESPVGGSESLRGMLKGVGAGYRSIEDVPEEFRPIAKGGEVVGESIPFVAAPLARAAQLGTKAATGITAPIVETARRAPGSFAAAEAGGVAGAAVGAGVAEAIAPGHLGAALTGELAGGLLSPVAVFARTARGISEGLTRLINSFTPEGSKREAGKAVRKTVRSLGGEPENLRQMLLEEQVTGAPVTAGQKTGSIPLLALERKLVEQSQKLGMEVAEQTQKSINEINAAFERAAANGDPEVLRELAKARKAYWDALLDARTSLAEEAATEAAKSIRPGGARPDANLIARGLIEDALGDARSHEKQLWAKIPKDAKLEPSNLKSAYGKATDDLLPGETLNIDNRAILDNLKKWAGSQSMTSGELLRLRGRLLAQARKMRGSQAPDWDTIRRLEDIQMSILDDLSKVGAEAEIARDFSRQLHDRFSRSSAGRVLGRDPRGGSRIEPELTLEKTVAPGGPAGAVAARQLEESVTPFGGMTASGAREMRQVQQELIRDMAVSTIDSNTGKIVPGNLGRFRERNKDLLARFPELDRTLKDAETATRVYGNRIKELARKDKIVSHNAAFAKVLDYEDPVRTITAAMSGKNPQGDLSRIFAMANKSAAAKAGAQSAFLKALFERSTSSRGLISGSTFLENLNLFKGPARLNKAQLRRLESVAEEATKLEEALAFSGSLDQVVSSPSDLFDLLVRVAGANVGGSSALGRTSGASLVLAGYGSRTARKWLEKVPMSRAKDVLAEAIRTPGLMADLLEEPATEIAKAAKDRRIHAWLLQMGIPEED